MRVSFAGVALAGRYSDRRPGLVVAVGGLLLMRLGSLADKPAALLVLVFAQGALSFALGSTLITQVLYKTVSAPTMAGSYATAAVIAAGTLSGGAGELGPLWASGLLVAVALLVALPFRDALTPGWSGVRRRAD